MFKRRVSVICAIAAILTSQLSYAGNEDSQKHLAGEIVSLEMELFAMLNVSLEGKPQSFIKEEHEKFKIKYEQLNKLKTELDEEARSLSLNADEITKGVIKDKILEVEGHLWALADKDLSGQPQSSIMAEKAEFERGMAELDLLKEELDRHTVGQALSKRVGVPYIQNQEHRKIRLGRAKQILVF
jgi:hypothetical protein